MHPISIAMPFDLGRDAKKREAEINKEIDKLTADDAELDERVSALNDVPDAAWTSKHASQASKLQDDRAESLKRQIALREKINDHLANVRDVEFHSAVDNLNAAKTTAEVKIAQGLAELGFVTDEFKRGIPGIVPLNPLVKSLRIQLDTLESSTPWLDAMQANAAAIMKCREKLAEFKSASTRLLAS